MILYRFRCDNIFKQHWRSLLAGQVHFGNWIDFNDPMEGFFSYVANSPDQSSHAANVVTQKQLFTVCCFAMECDHMLMWSHYTKNHRGVCLEFDVDEAVLTMAGIRYERVRYPNRIPNLSTTRSSQEQAIYALTRKLFFWRYEREFRLLAPTRTAGLHSVGTLKKVIFGQRFEFDPPCPGDQLSQQGTIISELRSNNVEIHKSDFNFQTYRISHAPTMKYG